MKWWAWILVLLTTLAINGARMVFFLGKHGLRQGDPLSPTSSYFLLSTCPVCWRRTRLKDSTIIPNIMIYHDILKLELNILKSNIYLAGVSDFEAYGILDLSWLTRGDYSFSYLGVPIIDEAIRVVHFSPLLDRLRDYVTEFSYLSCLLCSRLTWALENAKMIWLDLIVILRSLGILMIGELVCLLWVWFEVWIIDL